MSTAEVLRGGERVGAIVPRRSQDSGRTGAPPSGSSVADKARDEAEAEAFVEGLLNRDGSRREKFIPVTPIALMDRLAGNGCWPEGQAAKARRLFLYLANWRQQSYGARLLKLGRLYEPFNPDSDLLVTRTYSASERKGLERELVDEVRRLLVQANYTRIDPRHIDIILTKESHYGLDLHVDLAAFDELEIYYRGATRLTGTRRSRKKLYLFKEEFEYPVFQRLVILFKLKPEAQRAKELMAELGLTQQAAERRVRKMRGAIAEHVNPECVYLKKFKNIPQSDLEMVFPNTNIRFRLFDKIKLGVTAGGGLGVGVAGTLSKIAVASNPIALAGAVAGLGGVAVRQAVNFANQRNKYMVKMAQNLYAHALADNRGVMTVLAERAAEEDIKEEVLLYALVAKERVHVSELPAVDRAIEGYLAKTFGIEVNFDVEDAFNRLNADGLISVGADGWLHVLAPEPAAMQIDALWDGYLDKLTVVSSEAGAEQIGQAPPSLA